MDIFKEKILALIAELTSSVMELVSPIGILVGICVVILWGTSSSSNREKYRMWLFTIGGMAILCAALPYLVPWLIDMFKSTPTEAGAIIINGFLG